MNKFALLTSSFLCMGAAALFADAYNEHGMTENAFGQQSSGLLVMQDGQSGQTGARGSNEDRYAGGYTGGTGPTHSHITPIANPPMNNCVDPFITAEFIYWKAVQENIHYAFTGVNPTHPPVGSPKTGSLKSPEFEFEPGFKLGAGLRFKHDGWDVYANWTWLNEFKGRSHCGSNEHTASDPCDEDENSAAYTHLSSIDYSASRDVDGNAYNDATQFHFEEGHAKWEMQFNALDLELGRNFFISRHLTLRPHFGLKFGWISQEYHAEVHDTAFADDSEAEAKINQHFWGLGIRTGLDTVWYFSRHFGIYGDFAFGALWSDFHTRRQDTYEDPSNPRAKVARYKRHLETLTEVLELGLGLRYDTTFFVGDYAFFLQAGWEEQIWFNQNQYLDSRDTRSGNLTFHGLSIKAGLMF